MGMELKIAIALSQYKSFRISALGRCKIGQKLTYSTSTSTDVFIDHLVLEESSKQETYLFKYFNNKIYNFPYKNLIETCKNNKSYTDLTNTNTNIPDLVRCIEKEIEGENSVPNNKLTCLLIYYAKNGNISGIKAVQLIVKKNNISHFNSHSEYKHYLAEALWIDGKIDDSIKLFSSAYDNLQIRPKVKLMLACLFPLLITQHGKGTLCKTINNIEQLSMEKQDFMLLAYLWKVLFQSDWFSDQQLARQIIEKNTNLLKLVQWMIPSLGKEFLKNHKIEDFYRLLQLTLEYNLVKFRGLLLRLLFDYYYIHENIERCSAVVKYSSSLDSTLTEEQQRRYVGLLLKSKNSVQSKLNIKSPQNLKYMF